VLLLYVAGLQLEELDVSYNEWGKKGMEIINQALSHGWLRSLISTCCGGEDDDAGLDLL
jgi:hypothetical protein